MDWLLLSNIWNGLTPTKFEIVTHPTFSLQFCHALLRIPYKKLILWSFMDLCWILSITERYKSTVPLFLTFIFCSRVHYLYWSQRTKFSKLILKIILLEMRMNRCNENIWWIWITLDEFLECSNDFVTFYLIWYCGRQVMLSTDQWLASQFSFFLCLGFHSLTGIMFCFYFFFKKFKLRFFLHFILFSFWLEWCFCFIGMVQQS